MLAMDIVKPEPKTEAELRERWKNRLQAELQTLPYYKSKKIEVKHIEKLDDRLCEPDSIGRIECERNGFHSWFHHASDKQTSVGNLPEGFVEP